MRTTQPSVFGVEPVVVVAVEAAERGVVVLRLELDRAHAAEVGADALDVARRSSGTSPALLVKRAPLSGRSSPLFQKPRQSSWPSAVAIGAKFVSPPLFQSMYSRSRYSRVGNANGSVGEAARTPCAASASRRGCGVSSGISHDQ